MQEATAETTRSVINESSLSGVLAVYDVEGNRVINDYIFKSNSVVGGAGAGIGGDDNNNEYQNAKKELETLRQAYDQNRERLLREKKSLERIIGPLKKLVGDAAAAVLASSSAASSSSSNNNNNNGSGNGQQPPSSTSERKRRFDELGSESSSGRSTSPANLGNSGKTTTNKRGKPNPSNSSSNFNEGSGLGGVGSLGNGHGNGNTSSGNTSSNSNSGNGGPTSSYIPLTVGAQVAFRLHKQRVNTEEEEEWIQCEVTKVFADGARYEVRDPEPDENNNPGQYYKAGYRDLIRIPPPPDASNSNTGSSSGGGPAGSGSGSNGTGGASSSSSSAATLASSSANSDLPPLVHGQKVLARYPETTTFYRAEVVTVRRDGKCRLKFVGEEDEGKEQEVERRVVLPLPQYSR